MKNILLVMTGAALVSLCSPAPGPQPPDCTSIESGGQEYLLYPCSYSECPSLPSPYVSGDGKEHLTCRDAGNRFTIIPVTVENGEPFDYLGGNFRNKGRQLEVDKGDFPTPGKTGLHAEGELAGTSSITGRPVRQITALARPGGLSGSGFLGENEDIISVLRRDNHTVSSLGLTHPRLSRPLFQIFNIACASLEASGKAPPEIKVLYNGRWVAVRFQGGKGWQESIFNDEIMGYWQMDIRREFSPEENKLIETHFSHLNEKEKSALMDRLSHIRTGEMVPFFITRYGFYEGHTPYRAEPAAIAFIFGLKSLEEIIGALGPELPGL